MIPPSLPSLLAYTSSAAAIGLALVGCLRVRRGIAEWLFVLGMVLLAFERLFAGLSLGAHTLGGVERWQEWRHLPLSATGGAWLLFSLTFARYEAARYVRSWWPVWTVALLAPVAIAVIFRDRLFAGLAPDSTGSWVLRLNAPASLVHGVLLLASVLTLMNLERTFRGSVGTQRWRIKFLLLGVALIFVTYLYAHSQALLYTAIEAPIESVLSVAVLLACVAFTRALLRTWDFKADVYASQTVLQGSLTLALAGAYLLGVGVFAQIVVRYGGTSSFALKALLLLVSLVFLAVLLQSDRIRLLLRRLVSRHFQRPFYDYQQVWRRFSALTAGAAEVPQLCRNAVTLSAEVFQALSVTIWLVNERGTQCELAASTSLSGEKAAAAAPTAAETGIVLAHFRAQPRPAQVESEKAAWAAALRRWQPTEFPHGGRRIAAPLVRDGRLEGVILIGDRVSGAELPEQDFDMLTCIADHVATRLANVRLAQRLLQAKEVEAFQTMAAFFVHDLKNSASTLSLILQNLPVHFSDPEFRADSLRGMEKTVAHMNRLIARLGQLRHELTLQPVPTDLNTVVQRALIGWESGAGRTLVKDFAPLPEVPLDAEQLQKVVTNLLLNATEATPPEGTIHIRTGSRETELVLTVSDTGCGMSADFIQRSLFRPFQTTKKTGLGIGMFQSKMIVEAHGGRIGVTSAPGHGTTFEIFLPTHGN